MKKNNLKVLSIDYSQLTKTHIRLHFIAQKNILFPIDVSKKIHDILNNQNLINKIIKFNREKNTSNIHNNK